MNCGFWNNFKFGFGFSLGNGLARAFGCGFGGFMSMPAFGCNSLSLDWLTSPLTAINMWVANKRNYNYDLNYDGASIWNGVATNSLNVNYDTFVSVAASASASTGASISGLTDTSMYALSSIPTYSPTFNPDAYGFNFSNIGAFSAVRTQSDKVTYTGNLSDYNKEKGQRLANIAKKNTYYANGTYEIDKSRTKSPEKSVGYCARYVETAIAEAYNMQDRYRADAADLPALLRKDSNFKEISPDGVDITKLPAGCILCYGKGVAGYSQHVEITNGDGTASSDYTHQLSKDKKPTTIFIPV